MELLLGLRVLRGRSDGMFVVGIVGIWVKVLEMLRIFVFGDKLRERWINSISVRGGGECGVSLKFG